MSVSFSEIEKQILEYWEEKGIFKKSMDPKAPIYPNKDNVSREPFVFYDGPPFATGLPHYGHLLAGTIKDVIARYKTMQGYWVDRRFGWDCHGVPVEFEVQKSLDLKGSAEINEFGIDKFNEECRSIVLRYTKEWEKFVNRSGRWVDFDRQYRTMDLEYMESIWWVFKELWDKGFIYEGFKNVPYSWAISTPLSNFEANLNYQDVQDPAVTLKFELLDGSSICSGGGVFALAWTTTPWTLPSNMALAVGEDIDYVGIKHSGSTYILGKSLVDEHFKGKEYEEVWSGKGADLAGLSYKPLFNYFESERENNAFVIYTGDFVTTDSGTGIVHLASFGEDDLSLFQKHNITVIDPVDNDGNFRAEVTDYAGRNIKEADPDIIKDLKAADKLFSHKTINHSYPFCWRTNKPLIYKSISSWFVSVEKIKDRLVELNKEINWVPDHVGSGRMGMWLDGVKDWAISRNRFWGTPLPIWRCECGQAKCLGSVSELEKLSGSKVQDLHRHFIDDLTIECESCGKPMTRISEVLDCWFESGSMPYAQNHYPFNDNVDFSNVFPADFIAEGLDQTRGWFYTLLVIGTALFDKAAFKNVIVNGIVLAEDGKKMSKSLKNYPPVDEIMEELGSDSMRIYLLASGATKASELKLSKDGIKEVMRQTVLPLWNAYKFYSTYSEIDNWKYTQSDSQPQNVLDKWILSELASMASNMDKALSEYKIYLAVPHVISFIDKLTNTYIRLNRKRFWAAKGDEDMGKDDAYRTLYKCLVIVSRCLAPLAPFISEKIYNEVCGDDTSFESVHLTSFPAGEELIAMAIDPVLEKAMDYFQDIILSGRAIRNNVGIKLRQPMSKLSIINSNVKALESLKQIESYIKEELNVKSIEYINDDSSYMNLSTKLNMAKLGKELGPKLGKNGIRDLNKRVSNLSPSEVQLLDDGEELELEQMSLKGDDVLIRRELKDGVKDAIVVGSTALQFDTELTQELVYEGFSRELINRIQRTRKELDFNVTDRVKINIYQVQDTDGILVGSLAKHANHIKDEVLADTLEIVEAKNEGGIEFDIDSCKLELQITKNA